MDDKLVTLEKYETLYEAEFAKDVLEENGIKAMVVGDNLQVIPYIDQTVVVEVKVLTDDLDKAKDILKTQQDSENGEA